MIYQHLRLYSHYKIQHKHFTTRNDLSTFKILFTLQNTTQTFTTQNALSTFKTLFTLQNTNINISTTQNDLSTFKTLFTLQNTT